MPWLGAGESKFDRVPQQQINLRQGDRLTSFSAQALDEYGEPADLTGAVGYLTLRPLSPTIDTPMVELVQVVIEEPAQGVISYDWQAHQTLSAEPGSYEVTVEIVTASGERFTVPSTPQQFIANIRPGLASDAFVVDETGALIPDGEGGFNRFTPWLTEDGTYILLEDGTHLLWEE